MFLPDSSYIAGLEFHIEIHRPYVESLGVVGHYPLKDGAASLGESMLVLHLPPFAYDLNIYKRKKRDK